MTRPLRISYPGASYHLYCRGNKKEPIFFSDRDRFLFMQKLNETVDKYGYILYAFCLMPNHYHLYLRITRPNLSAGIHFLNAGYSNWLKAKRKIVGHVFQGRFRSIIVDDASYALFLSSYIHLNPVKAKICAFPDQFRWSSYLDVVGDRKNFAKGLDRDFLLSFLHPDPIKAVPLYKKYLRRQKSEVRIDDYVAHGIALGDDEFIRKLRAEINVKGNRREIAAEFREDRQPITIDHICEIVENILPETQGAGRPEERILESPLEDLGDPIGFREMSVRALGKSGKYKKLKRNLIIYLAKKYCHLTLREIGVPWNLDYGAVAQIARRLEKEREEDDSLDALIQKTEESLGVRSLQKMFNVKT